MKPNRNSSAETDVDSSTQPKLQRQAKLLPNPMLVAVLSAFVSAYKWVREESFVGRLIDEWLGFIIPAFKLKSSFNWLGLVTLYPIFITIAFVVSFSMLLILSAIATVLGAIRYFSCLIVLIFLKRDVSKNSR